jgi:hypothetical protein
VRRERPRGRTRGQVRASRAGSLTPLPRCDTGNRAVTGRQRAPPACVAAFARRRYCFCSWRPRISGRSYAWRMGAQSHWRAGGANRAFGQRSPFSAPSSREHRPMVAPRQERAHPPDAEAVHGSLRFMTPRRGCARRRFGPAGAPSRGPSRAARARRRVEQGSAQGARAPVTTTVQARAGTSSPLWGVGTDGTDARGTDRARPPTTTSCLATLTARVPIAQERAFRRRPSSLRSP